MSGPAVLRSLAYALVYIAAGFVGRATVVDDGSMSLVWPAAGVAVLWFLRQGRETRTLDVALLSVSVLGVNLVTGAPAGLAGILLVSNLVQTFVAVAVLRRWSGELWGNGGSRTIDTTFALLRVVLASVLAALVGASVGTLGLWLVNDTFAWSASLVWWGRNLAGMVAVTSLGHLVLHRLRFGPPDRPPHLGGLAGPVEASALVAVTVAAYAVAFLQSELPLAFPLLAISVWAGLRLPTHLVVQHATACGTIAVGFTLAGRGPFARVDDVTSAALLAQLFVLLVIVTSLALATSGDERDELSQTLLAAQQEAVAQASMMSTVVASVSEGITVVNARGDMLVANDAARLSLGYDSVDSIPGKFPSLQGYTVNGAEIAAADRPSHRALRGETVRDQDIVLLSPDGADRILSVSAAPMPPDEGGVARAVMVFRDVTDDRRQRDELGSFAGVVAHDLRNPLGVVDGWVEALDDELVAMAQGSEVDPAALQGMLDRVKGASVRMRRLIEDLLAHATAQNRTLELVKVDLENMVRDVVSARGARDVVELGMLPFVQADGPLVRQLLDNLVGNALTYVASDVAPHVVVCGVEDGDVARIRVTDNGIGIPTGHHRLIFQQFHRAHAASYTGTGLGLAICQRIVERHGGTIAAMPGANGQGSVFEFTLPLAGASSASHLN
jgi:PAS domain S-box-containing protein